MIKVKETVLKNIINPEKKSIISGPFGSNISSKYFVSTGIPVIRGNNLTLSSEIKFKDTGFVFVTSEKAKELNCYAHKGDLIFTAAGTIGQVGLIPSDAKYDNYVISNKQIRVTLDTSKVDILYAYYWFSSPWIRKYLIRNNKGSTVPLLTLNEIKSLPIKFPVDLKAQRRIVSTLELLNSKIKNNNLISKELESLAKTIYDYWFLQFEFPDKDGKPYKSNGGKMVWSDQLNQEIPDGWTFQDIKNICKIIDCLHSKKPSYKFESKDAFLLTLDNIGNFGLIDDSKRYYISIDDYKKWTSHIEVHNGDFVITNAGRTGDIARVPAGVKAAIGRNLTAVRPEKISSYYLQMYFKSTYTEQQILKNLDSGSFFKSFNVKSIKKLKILVPDSNTMNLFLKYFSPLLDKIEINMRENQQLKTLHDFLLPILMNGQITTKD